MIYHCDVEYSKLLYDLQDFGDHIHTRNGDVRRITARTLSFTSFPLISLRRVAWKKALLEWEWFMSGSNVIGDLHLSVRSWWQPWAGENGQVNNNYSDQFRNSYGLRGPVDQIQLLIDGIKDHPYSRRNVITTWNTSDMVHPSTPITNCHGTVIQCFVNPDNTLDLITYQRSVDVICGLPHNLVQYYAFLMWLAHRGSRKVGRLTWIGGDIHLYAQHYDLAQRINAAYPELRKNGPLDLVYAPSSEEFLAEDFSLNGEYAPVITERAEMVV